MVHMTEAECYLAKELAKLKRAQDALREITAFAAEILIVLAVFVAGKESGHSTMMSAIAAIIIGAWVRFLFQSRAPKTLTHDANGKAIWLPE